MKKLFFLLKKWWVLFFIFFIALFLRLFFLGNIPNGFFHDEVLTGYLGRFLIENGVDLFGNKLPFYFNQFGDYYLILPMYLAGLSTLIFGVNVFAVRFMMAFFGALTIFPFAWLAFLLSKKKSISLISSFMLAVVPWHLVLSRTTTESVFESFLLILGLDLLLFSFFKKRKFTLLLADILFFIAYFTYQTAKVYVPMILIGILFYFICINFHKLKKYFWEFSLLIISLIFFIGLTMFIGQTEWGRGRFKQTSIFGDQARVKGKIEELNYDLGHNSVLLARVFHNKIFLFAREFIFQYSSHLSLSFLLTDRGWIDKRYAIPEIGPFFFTSFLIFFSLAIPLNLNKKFKGMSPLNLFLLLFLLIIAPIPASFTAVESPNIRRSIFLIFPLIISMSLALYRSHFIFWKKLKLSYFFILLLFGETIINLFFYFKHPDLNNAFYRNDGYLEVGKYLNEKMNTENVNFYASDKDLISLYYLFNKKDFNIKYSKEFKEFVKIDRIDKIKFINVDCVSSVADLHSSNNKNSIFIENYSCGFDKDSFEVIERIKGSSVLSGFNILKIKNKAI